MNNILRNILWWGGILLLQMVLIFYFRPTMIYTPYIYLLLLFRISSNVSRIGLLLVAFFAGLLMDTFTNSWGVHTFSAVFIAFVLPLFVNLFSEHPINEEVKFLPQTMGELRYGIAICLLFFFYHSIALLLWNFSSGLLFYQLLKAFLSSTIACGIAFLLHSLFKRKKEEDDG